MVQDRDTHWHTIQSIQTTKIISQKLLDKVKQLQTRKDPFILGCSEDFAILEYDTSDQKCGLNNFTSNYANLQEFADLFPDLNEVF